MDKKDLRRMGLPGPLASWLLKKYSGCPREVLEEHARKLVEEYKELERSVSKAAGKLKLLSCIEPKLQLAFKIGKDPKVSVWDELGIKRVPASKMKRRL
jgi:hypothetical protein